MSSAPLIPCRFNNFWGPYLCQLFIPEYKPHFSRGKVTIGQKVEPLRAQQISRGRDYSCPCHELAVTISTYVARYRPMFLAACIRKPREVSQFHKAFGAALGPLSEAQPFGMKSTAGRIPEGAFKAVSGLMFGISIVAAATRISIRLRSLQRLYLDDFLLIFACICLTAATVLLYYGASATYFVEQLTFEPAEAIASGAISSEELPQELLLFGRINWSYLVLTWGGIFSVKFAFLSFFRPLVNRLPRTHMYWRVIVVITALVFVFAVCDTFIACTKLGLAALQCSQRKRLEKSLIPGATAITLDIITDLRLEKSLILGATAITLDIITDLLILAIPVSLLWRVRMRPRQKLGLGVFLCLNICMIIVAIIRIAGIHYHGAFDISWIYLWQQVETCVAVTMISLTAFRSVFVAGASSSNRIKKASPWVPSNRKVFRRHRGLDSDDHNLADLTIPSATLTGMRTLIRGGPDEELAVSRSWDGNAFSGS